MNAVHSTRLFTHSPITPCNITHQALYHVVGTHLQSACHDTFTPTKLRRLHSGHTTRTCVQRCCPSDHKRNHHKIQETGQQSPPNSMDNSNVQGIRLTRARVGWQQRHRHNILHVARRFDIPHDGTVTYARIVVDYRPQKEDPNCVHITVGGNLINYPGELTTRTADLTTANILWNSTISTPGARFACADIENMSLQTPMDRYKYMRIKADLIPDAFRDAYNLWDKIYNGYVYMEIRRGCYWLPQADILANKLLKQRLATDGYFELPHTPGLFKHISRPVQFSLVVDDFGIKYTGQQHLDHLIASIKKHYNVTVDHTGSLYCGITLNWQYNKGFLDISMPGYVQKQLIKYNHPKPKQPVHTPWEPYPIKYGSPVQQTLPNDDSPPP
eukprot:CCRYP_007399-RA/>CCRYP_007399-RA protein AED:0.38 eAED:0.38 QI:0/0/0/1/0/0/2/0/385